MDDDEEEKFDSEEEAEAYQKMMGSYMDIYARNRAFQSYLKKELEAGRNCVRVPSEFTNQINYPLYLVFTNARMGNKKPEDSFNDTNSMPFPQIFSLILN